jgi:disulfide bond formation protein DsbB
MSQNQLAMVGFFVGLLFALVGCVCSLKILRKMRSEGFGVCDLWDPTGKLYRRYVQEAKLHNWSLLPLYIPGVLGVLFFCYFLIAVTLVVVRAAF